MTTGDLVRIYGGHNIGIVLKIEESQVECFWDHGKVLWCGLWILEVVNEV